MYRLMTSILAVVTLALTSTIWTDAMAAKGGKPGGGDGSGSNCTTNALFPALAYPVGSSAGDGTSDIILVSSDGCDQLTVEQSIQLGGVRLQYDSDTHSGYYAWAENVAPGYPPGSIERQPFTVSGGALIPSTPEPETIYQGTGYLSAFDIRGDTLALLDDVSGETRVLVVDLGTCGGTVPCDANDAYSAYSPGTDCLQDAAMIGCFGTWGGLAISPDETAVYFDGYGKNSAGDRIYGIARVTRDAAQGWPQSAVEFYLRDDNYYEPRVYGFDPSGRYLAIGYLAGIQRLRDDRVIIFDTDLTAQGCPCEAAGLSQDFAAWTATWTIDSTFYVLGTAGKGRKLSHPIEEFDPSTGVRGSLGITLDSHPGIDSSL